MDEERQTIEKGKDRTDGWTDSCSRNHTGPTIQAAPHNSNNSAVMATSGGQSFLEHSPAGFAIICVRPMRCGADAGAAE